MAFRFMNNLIEFCRFTLYTPTNTMQYFWPNFDFIDGVSRDTKKK